MRRLFAQTVFHVLVAFGRIDKVETEMELPLVAGHDVKTVAVAMFFRHESCGKCTPCREGTYWMSNIIERIHHGQGTTGDVDLLLNVAKQIQGKCLCALGEFSTMAVVTGIERFPQDFKNAVTPEPLPHLYVQEREIGKA